MCFGPSTFGAGGNTRLAVYVWLLWFTRGVRDGFLEQPFGVGTNHVYVWVAGTGRKVGCAFDAAAASDSDGSDIEI